jgi:hypothetical protein
LANWFDDTSTQIDASQSQSQRQSAQDLVDNWWDDTSAQVDASAQKLARTSAFCFDTPQQAKTLLFEVSQVCFCIFFLCLIVFVS